MEPPTSSRGPRTATARPQPRHQSDAWTAADSERHDVCGLYCDSTSRVGPDQSAVHHAQSMEGRTALCELREGLRCLAPTSRRCSRERGAGVAVARVVG
jgi:hypothetical protein